MEKEVKTQKCPDLCPETETETFIFSIAVYRKIANSVFSNRHNYNCVNQTFPHKDEALFCRNTKCHLL